MKKQFLLPLTVGALLLGGPAMGEQVLETEQGKATWYGKGFDGKKTASGVKFNSDHPVAAHPEWPFGTEVRVTNLNNDKAIKVRIVDRGPSKKVRKKGVLIDVSHGVAKVLGFVDKGVTKVKLEVLRWGKPES